jgi:hypothetical protein
MTTKTTITLSPIKRCYTSPHLKRRRMTSISTNRKHQMKLPDLVHDICIEQQRRESIINIATILRKVGDQMDEQLQVIFVKNFYIWTILFLYLDEQHFIFESDIWSTNY